MCLEVELNGRAAAGRPVEVGESMPRLILRTDGIDVMAGLGSLAPGYTLLVPHRHVPSSGDLEPHERAVLHATARVVGQEIEKVFGCRVALVEHGSSGKASGRSGGGCITHCHLHLLPLARDVDPEILVPRESHRIDDLSPLVTAASRRENYYYCSWFASGGHFSTNPQLSSQHARRIWAHSLGQPDQWDWALFPYIDNCRITVESLRPSEAHMSERLSAAIVDETIATYTGNAARYAADTEKFAVNSTLPGQMDALLKATTGPVLDAGAGAGRDAEYMAATGRTVIALDASGTLLTELEWDHAFGRVVGDVRRIPLADSSVGAIWCSAVLLHLGQRDVRHALRDLARVLRPGGLMQISVKRGRGMRTEPLADSGTLRHFFLYDADQLCAMAVAAGLEVVRTWTEDEDGSARTLQNWAKIVTRKPG